MKKGFIFTAVVVLVLFVLVLAVSYYVQTINEREQRAEEKFKFIAMGQIFDMVSEEEIGDFAEMSSFYALYSLNEHIIKKTRPLKQYGTAMDTNGNKGTKYVNMSIYSLMTEGKVPMSYFSIMVGGDYNYEIGEKEKYTFVEWGTKINQICAQLGYVCEISDMRNFTFKQVDPWNVNIYFEATTNVESNDGRFSRIQNITINRTYSIEGFNDAAVSILIKEESGNEDARRQIFKYKSSELDHPNVEDINIEIISDGANKGKGFFYGPVIPFKTIVNEPTPGVISEIYTNHKSPKYIVESNAIDWDVLSEVQKGLILDSYGAFIVKNVRNDCMEVNASATNSGSFTLTMCEGKLGQTEVNINLRCEVTCTYQNCDATLCPFDCYEGLTDCSWNNELSTSSLVLTHYVCDITDPSDDENVFDIFRTKYSAQYDLICNQGSVSLPSDLGTGVVTNSISKPYLMYNIGVSSPSLSSVEKPGNYNGTDELYGELSDKRFVLINNENDHDVSASDAFYGFHELWDLNDLREMIMCGAYIETNESDIYGPSFFQRMIEEPWELDSDNFGLETFLVGPYAGGYHNPDKDNLCQLDRNFARDRSGEHMIKGMPGCNSFDMTSTYMDSDDPVVTVGTGHFTITNEIMQQYGLERITCIEDNGARCE
ncbi:hypothetical protein KO317_03060 [Candidatus Micrarchaeota archaeon]|nr:hypothetical protein [Candidatus Micrarchaeota archaeon]